MIAQTSMVAAGRYNDDEDNDNYSEGARKQKQKRPPTPFRPHVRRTCFTAEADYLCGYEGGRRRPSHPDNADPGSARGDMELTLLVEWKTNIVAKVNSYGSFGLGVEFTARI